MATRLWAYAAMAGLGSLAIGSAVPAQAAKVAPVASLGPAAQAPSPDQRAYEDAPSDMQSAAYLLPDRRIGVLVNTRAERASVIARGLVPIQRERGYRRLAELRAAVVASARSERSSMVVGVDPVRDVVQVVLGDPGPRAKDRAASSGGESQATPGLLTSPGVQVATGSMPDDLVAARPGAAPAAPEARGLVRLLGGWSVSLYLPGYNVCTSGFNATIKNGTQKVNLTAGHCTGPANGLHYRLLVGSTTVGQSGPQDTITDQGLNYVFSSTYAPGLVANRARLGSDYLITNALMPVVNMPVCKEGMKSGQTCGRIQIVNTTWVKDGVTTYGLTKSSMCADEGDSGSPVLTYLNGGNSSAQGVAVLVARHKKAGHQCDYNENWDDVYDDPKYGSYMAPLPSLLRRFGATLAY